MKTIRLKFKLKHAIVTRRKTVNAHTTLTHHNAVNEDGITWIDREIKFDAFEPTARKFDINMDLSAVELKLMSFYGKSYK